ncbi:hypothetical protein FGG08_004913 [Glutinoglossum americanum]|uniref:DNA primase n=1 Tax=Glutinoglossum americanum TaxID=1670608 RepID=A0A9P8HZJ6_9PEZI|nr:hypothetical protein FGG08_004913 [Glutinoglossum americanum]
MPHPVSPEVSTPEQEDGGLPDASENEEGQQGDEVASAGEDQMDIESPPMPVVVKEEVRLDDMFDDDDDDDDDDEYGEFPESSVPEIKPEGAQDAPIVTAPSARYSDPEIMYAFYQRLFPFRYLFQWLNHSPSPTNDFGHREFAFTLQNDAYLRYQAFPTADLLRKEILRLNPSRFEIGPVYNTNPRDRKTLRKASHFRPVAKELVFDIDLTDYDEIRTCCDKANICRKCWTFVTMAIKVVDAALRDDFGFQHILWVYSGRRGAHAWVCDKRAREMDDPKRKAIAGYLEVVKGGAQSGKKVNVKRPLHPHLSRSLDILKDHFQSDILEVQDPWRDPTRSDRLLHLLPDRALNDSLRKKWDSSPLRPSTSKWADIDALAKAGASRSLDAKALLEAKQDVVLEYTYPRLDVEVSKKLIHLLKSPFVVHPGTGRVCVPIDPRRLEEFDPLSVPTVTELLGEIDQWGAVGTNGEVAAGDAGGGGEESKAGVARRVQDYEKTRLKPFVDYFKGFVVGLMRDEKGGVGVDGRKIKREKTEEEEDNGGEDRMEF